MAKGKPLLTVSVSPDADNDLWEIWGDNVQLYKNVDLADSYLAFLRTGINQLGSSYPDGRDVEGFPEFQYVILRRSKKGHGHCVIF